MQKYYINGGCGCFKWIDHLIGGTQQNSKKNNEGEDVSSFEIEVHFLKLRVALRFYKGSMQLICCLELVC